MAAQARPSEIGIFGLHVMGKNLALNFASKGIRVSIYNRNASKIDETRQQAETEGTDEYINACYDAAQFVGSLNFPRRIIMMVKAGDAVDEVIKRVLPFLEKRDILIDGGNEWFENTERRAKELHHKGVRYLGMGIAGGSESARYGPALLFGGDKTGFETVESLMKKITAKVDSKPCLTYLGAGGAGHYVKMLHNGIEYALMELIAETYDLMQQVGHFTNDEVQRTFSEWNNIELESFLMGITAKIFLKKDEETGNGQLIDHVLDRPQAKGTGAWSIIQAANYGVPASTLSSALDARYVAARLNERKQAAKLFYYKPHTPKLSHTELAENLKQALYAANLIVFAQGLDVIRESAKERQWTVNMEELARVWQAGSIVSCAMLNTIKEAFHKSANLTNLLFDPELSMNLQHRQESYRRVVCLSVAAGIAVPTYSSGLTYFDMYRRERLPANLIQAQRDYFGAHTYERTDLGGKHHTEWTKGADVSRVGYSGEVLNAN